MFDSIRKSLGMKESTQKMPKGSSGQKLGSSADGRQEISTVGQRKSPSSSAKDSQTNKGETKSSAAPREEIVDGVIEEYDVVFNKQTLGLTFSGSSEGTSTGFAVHSVDMSSEGFGEVRVGDRVLKVEGGELSDYDEFVMIVQVSPNAP